MRTEINQFAFTGQNFYCGVDTHKKNWTVTIETDDMALKTFSQESDSSILVRYLKKNYPGGNYIVGYEAGYFGYGLQRELAALGISCMVIHPADIPTTHKEKDQKQDARDSRKIARAIKNKEVTPIWVPSVPVEQDRQLLRARHTLTKDQTRTKNRIKAILQLDQISYPLAFSHAGSHWSKRFITWLEGLVLAHSSGTEALQLQVRHLQYHRSELLLISKKIRDLSKSERYVKNCNKLINIQGIGVLTAMTFLTEIGDIFRFKNSDAFRSYIGMVPRTNSSGEKDYHGKITNRANAYLRFLLVEAAWVAIRSDPYYLNMYRQFMKRMKANKALIRVAGKIANRIFYCLRSEKSHIN